MQYGHCVVIATAIAISSLFLAEITPSAIAALSKAMNPCHAAGASSAYCFNFFMLFMSYIGCLRVEFATTHFCHGKSVRDIHWMSIAGGDRSPDRDPALRQARRPRHLAA